MKPNRYRKQWSQLQQPAIRLNKIIYKPVFLGIMLLTFLGIVLNHTAFAYTDITDNNNVGIHTPSSAHQFVAVNTSDRLIEGQQQYASGQLSAALQSWKQAAEALTSHPLDRAAALGYVSIAAQDLGDWAQAETAVSNGFSILAAHPDMDGWQQAQAQMLNVQGRLHLKRGKPEIAWETWSEAEAAYAQSGDDLGQVGARINQSQALQTMGLYRRARLQLESVAEQLAAQPDSLVKAVTLKSLGNVFQTAGGLEQSQQYLNQSLAIYRHLGSDTEVADALFNLANTLRLMKESEAAEQQYKAAESLLLPSALKTRSQLNRFNLLLETQQWSAAENLLPALVTQVKALPASRQTVYSRVNLAESLLSHENDTHQPINWLSVESVADLLREGVHQADIIEDNRAKAFSLGALSKLYGYTQQWSESQALAQEALSLSQRNNAQDMAYRWQQQLGKAYHQQGKDDDAIASYTNAVETLGIIRRDLLATNVDVQYSFRETVEPVYRELVSLLLLPEDASQESLSQARNVIEELQLAEMENYFRSACIDSATESIDKLDSEAAVLYPVVLSDRIEVVASFPEQPLQHYRTWQTEEETNLVIGRLYRYLNPILSEETRLNLSKEIYDWLITPIEVALSRNEIHTLVFVLDGQFRRIPMSALYDGEHYLLENYGVALTPGLRLLGPHFQDPKPLQALMLGLTEARGGFSALPGVKLEIEQISDSVNAKVLVDRDFTRDNLATEIGRVPFPILHLATHGQFSSDLEETYLLAWDQRISVSDLDSLLRARKEQDEPIELMVLSACQTAEGDDRAALGLAGMAVRSGARSTLATLWSVNDQSTSALMTLFYQELSNAELTKAEALRRAQVKILQIPEYSHPYYWAPFVLIGNWLS
ncbi:MAG: CHAT domain-containing protein [Cyanobacteria bacterium J06649_4]